METIPPTSTSTCSGAASIIAVASPIQTHCHPRASSKPRFPRLAKSIIISSTLQRLNKSKFSSSSNTVCPILPAIPRPHTIIRSILQSKPPPSLIEQGSPTFVLASPFGPSLSIVQPIRKRVRFSGEAGTGTSVNLGEGSRQDEEKESEGGQQMSTSSRVSEPVIETVFLTYSRAAYDRSPIAVDRVLNKSLTLPPRTEEGEDEDWLEGKETERSDEDPPLRGGRWLTAQLEPYELSLRDQSRHSGDQESTILLPIERQMSSPPQILPPNEPPQVFLSAPSPHHASSWPTTSRAPQPLFGGHPWPLDDALSESMGSSSSSCSSSSSSCSTQDQHPAVLAELHPLPLPRFHPNESAQPDGHLISVQNLAHHQLSNLSLHRDASPTMVDAQSHSTASLCCINPNLPLSGFGNWTRAQVFDSCDALDGF